MLLRVLLTRSRMGFSQGEGKAARPPGDSGSTPDPTHRFPRSARGDLATEPSTEETVTGLIRNHLTPYFGPRDLKLIRETDVSDFAGQLMESGKSEAVAFNAVSLLRRVCSLHVDAGLLDSNPAKGAKKIASNRKTLIFFSLQPCNKCLMCIIRLNSSCLFLCNDFGKGSEDHKK